MKYLFHYALIVGIFFFISFCVNGIRSVSNDKHIGICFDKWHNYSFVLIFDELLNERGFFFGGGGGCVFFNQYYR